VEFTVSAAYGFAGWRAYRTADLGGKGQAALEGAVPLTAAEAAISDGTDGGASVTINITDAITLVPWCEDRPRITQANPPLINSGISYTRGQRITIWFATALDADTVKFGEGFIEISGQTIGESSEPYDDTATPGVNENGDLTGGQTGAMRFFKNPVYDPNAKTITIEPDNSGESRTALPPGDTVITVTVGANVRSPNGNGVTSPMSFYYRTNTLEFRNVYTAETIWAIHKPDDSPGAEKFFYTGADTGRDRRLRKNGSGSYEVTLYFTVQASNPAEMTDPFTHVKVAELRYANPEGGQTMTWGTEKTYTLTLAETGAGTAGEIYRQNSGVTAAYTITHELQTSSPQPGIYRLIVLPYRDTGTPDVYTDTGDIEPDTGENAHAEGRYAAAVLDNLGPSGSAILSFTGPGAEGYAASQTEGQYTRYNYGKNNKKMSFTANFSGVADNGGFGILPDRATMDRPWTMDSSGAIQWQYRIDGAVTNPDPNNWFDISAASVSITDISTVLASSTTVRDLQFRYKDGLGNESGWVTAAKIYYHEDQLTAINAWEAAYYETAQSGVTLNGSVINNVPANSIVAAWTNPGTDLTGVEASYTVNDGVSIPLEVQNPSAAKSYALISGVPRINAGGVLSGSGVSNVAGYTITLTVKSATNSLDTPLKIWNIPDMSVSSGNPAIEVNSVSGDPDTSDGYISLAAIPVGAGSSGKTCVLVNDITLAAGWTPVGTGTGAGAFQGKFYGNGHTITVSGNPANAAYTGVFGYASGAEIRDLSVHYAANVTAAPSATYIGGLVGYADGGTKIRNVLATGTGSAALIYSGSGTPYAGGIAGYLYGGESRIENCYGSLNLKVSTTTTTSPSYTYAGGIVGEIDTASLTDCVWTGNLEFSSGSSGHTAYVGGIAGFFRSSSDNVSPKPTVRNAAARGNVTAAGKNIYAAGLIGQAFAAESSTLQLVADSYYEGGFIRLDGNGSELTDNCYVGGLFGAVGNYDSTIPANPTNMRPGPEVTNCFSRAGGITVSYEGTNGYVHLGGFAGAVCATEIEGCYSESPLTLIEEDKGATFTNVGGFIGDMRNYTGKTSAVTSCYATASINVTGEIPRAGGLIGMSAGHDGASNRISKSYATGNITTTANRNSYTGGLLGYGTCTTVSESWASGSVHAGGSLSNSDKIYAGGLVSVLAADSKIENSYALGDVLADHPYSGGTVYAGGLVGYIDSDLDAGYGVYFSFAKGSVTAQNNYNSSTEYVYAGGLVGHRGSGDIQHCVALGDTVIVKSPNTTNRRAARVYGYPASSIGTANYGFTWMSVEIHNKYRNGTVTEGAVSSDLAGPHGMNSNAGTGADALGNKNFWTSTTAGPGFNSVQVPAEGDVPAHYAWNMNGVARGYPKLENVGGQ
jgi:hypothetical protein